MSNVNVEYGIQVYDGINGNLLSLSRAGTFSFSNYSILFNERLVIAVNTTAQQISIPINGSVLLIENLGSLPIIALINSNSGTQLQIAAATATASGILELTTGLGGLTSLYLTNGSTTVAASVNVIVAG